MVQMIQRIARPRTAKEMLAARSKVMKEKVITVKTVLNDFTALWSIFYLKRWFSFTTIFLNPREWHYLKIKMFSNLEKYLLVMTIKKWFFVFSLFICDSYLNRSFHSNNNKLVEGEETKKIISWLKKTITMQNRGRFFFL